MPRAGLDRERLITAAAAIADSEGLAAVTFARLAQVLKVKPPSLYNHIDSLSVLHDELSMMAFRDLLDVSCEAVMGRQGVDALKALADKQRAYSKAHPGIYEATLRPLHGRGHKAEAIAGRYIAIFEAVLRGFGVNGEASIHMIRCLRAAVSGFIELELRGGFAMDANVDESFFRLIEVLAAGIEAHAAPAGSRTAR